MLQALTDPAWQLAAACLTMLDWCHLLRVSKTVKQRVLDTMQHQQHRLELDLSPRQKHRALQQLRFAGDTSRKPDWMVSQNGVCAGYAGTYCPNVSTLSLQHGSAHSLTSLQLLQPCLTEALQEVALRGLDLTQTAAVATTGPANSRCSMHSSNNDPGRQHVSRSCSCGAAQYSCLACQLVELLIEKCPALVKLDLQECQLPALDLLHPLFKYSYQTDTQGAQLQRPMTQQSHKHHRLAVLQLTNAVFSSHQCSQQHNRILGPAVAHTAAFSNGSQHNSKPMAASHTAEQGALAALQQRDSNNSNEHHTLPVTGIQELYLGRTVAFAQPRRARVGAHIAEEVIIELLQLAGGQALRVVDVCRQSSVDDSLLLYLAQHAPCLEVLDVGLTAVTPAAVLQLVQSCRHLTTLKYVCRTGCRSLDASTMQQLVMAGQRLQEVDLSLHDQLDDECLRALAGLPQLQKVTLSRSHKVTAVGIESLLQAGTVQTVTMIRCKGCSKQKVLQLRTQYPAVSIHLER